MTLTALPFRHRNDHGHHYGVCHHTHGRARGDRLRPIASGAPPVELRPRAAAPPLLIAQGRVA